MVLLPIDCSTALSRSSSNGDLETRIAHVWIVVDRGRFKSKVSARLGEEP